MQYRTQEGDRLDQICTWFYGLSRRHVENVLSVNPGLSYYGPRLPSGLLIELPEFDSKAHDHPSPIRLWD
ncbi:tail protein X [Teredinibacter sp. KSP-S5-2]|uniref:tail protein X n=1 Tax=Teredinibacter sp. KSP-S5-2 TaxID=3034506 RepID=UPI002934BEF6|nr:tail protein X [Teredinibacter sp. KSP-S5-2]WNO10451.1 tail protein X [Teredinibacter sp. KSP-S5-2]